MATSANDMRDKLLREIGLSNNSDAQAAVLGFLNDFKINVLWPRHAWREKFREAVLVTTAPYDDGTVTTDGTDDIVGSGTTWTSAHQGMKFALGLSSPWYTNVTRGSDTTMALDRVVLEDDVSGSEYIFYQDEYGLAGDLLNIRKRSLVMMVAGDDRPLIHVDDEDWLSSGVIPGVSGKPRMFRIIHESTTDPSTAAQQIQLWPVPDQAYAIHYEYEIEPTLMTAGGTESEIQFRNQLRDLMVIGARPDAYRYIRDFQGAAYHQSLVEPAIRKAWRDHQRVKPRSAIRRGVDGGSRSDSRTFRFTVS